MKFSENWLREWLPFSFTTEQLKEKLTMAGLEVDNVSPVPPLSVQAGELDSVYLTTSDQVIELDLTPNRGDCLSVLGIAREVAALYDTQYVVPKAVDQYATVAHMQKGQAYHLPIEVEAQAACPHYCARILRNLQPAKTPLWMEARLKRSDIGCVHPVVDILNYVMLELGQPLHAFDLDKIEGKVVVRHAREKEVFTLLNNQTVNLTTSTLVIADSTSVLAMAGIMGGKDSGVSVSTQHILIESALFASEGILGKARSYGLHTDASFRFERGVDPQLQVRALERATALIVDICQGQAGPILESSGALSPTVILSLRYARLEQILGYAIPPERVVNILTRLGCVCLDTRVATQRNPNHSQESSSLDALKWQVTVPSFRADIATEIDLIEEVARVYGYTHIPSTLPTTQLALSVCQASPIAIERVKRALVDFGYQEVITYSFVDAALQTPLFPVQTALALLNPISSEMGVMRVSLWPGLLSTLRYNQHRQCTRLKIFETGLVFEKREGAIYQTEKVAGLIFGDTLDEHWGEKARAYDFYDIKAHVEALWSLMGGATQSTLRFVAKKDKTSTLESTMCNALVLHPGQSASILLEGQPIGEIGRLHPQHEKVLDLEGPIYLFELFASAMQLSPTRFQRPSRFPENRRDIALIVEQQVESEQLVNCLKKSAPHWLREIKIFDVYTGKGVAPGKKSIAFSLILQHPSRTLVEQEIEEVVYAMVSQLKAEYNAELRD